MAIYEKQIGRIFFFLIVNIFTICILQLFSECLQKCFELTRIYAFGYREWGEGCFSYKFYSYSQMGVKTTTSKRLL